MTRENVVPLLVIAIVVAAGWFYREPLVQQFNKSQASLAALPTLGGQEAEAPSPAAAEPVPRKDTVYRWVDENGGVHYDQRQAAGSEAVIVDQGRIQSIENYGQPDAHANGTTPVIEADGDAPKTSVRAVDRFPQAQAAPL